MDTAQQYTAAAMIPRNNSSPRMILDLHFSRLFKRSSVHSPGERPDFFPKVKPLRGRFELELLLMIYLLLRWTSPMLVPVGTQPLSDDCLPKEIRPAHCFSPLLGREPVTNPQRRGVFSEWFFRTADRTKSVPPRPRTARRDILN